MRKSLLVISALLVLAPQPLTFSEETDQTVRPARYSCATSAVLNGRTHRLEIPVQEIEASPEWTLESGDEPPVSVAQATQTAIAEFNRYMSDPDSWVMLDVTLKKLCSSQDWAYMVSWQRKDKREISSVTVPVLMSGNAVSLDGLSSQKPKTR